MRKDKTLKETKVLLTESEDKLLQQIANADGGRSKTNFCTNEIRKLLLNIRQKKDNDQKRKK